MEHNANKTIITVVGKDTVGIIAKVCTYLSENGVNVLDISQTIVSGYFNMMMECHSISKTINLQKLLQTARKIWTYWARRSAYRSSARKQRSSI